jgi:tetratricopeptide (TPR) repeat protein
MAWRLIQAGRDAGDTSMPGINAMYQNIRRWERGEWTPTERYKLCYCTALAITPDQFGTAPPARPAAQPRAVALVPGSSMTVPPYANPAARNLVDPRLPASITVAYRGIHESAMGGFTVEREVLMTAHESSDHAEQAGQPGIGDLTFEQLRADVTRLAWLSDTGEPFAAFLDMRRVRDRIYKLLDRQLWPREQTDLYFLLGCLDGLMGIAANRLGYPDAAEELLRAGWAYAHTIGHHPLRGQLRQQLSSVLYLRGRFRESSELALSGLQYVPDGPEAGHLHLNYARALARMGEMDNARQAVRDAHEARERPYRDELLEIGGEYAVSQATHHYLAGSALAADDESSGEAADELEQAISLYDAGPGDGEQHWFGGKPLAGIDLAMIRLRAGALDGAAVALEPVLSMPTTQRIADFTARLDTVRNELFAPIFRSSAQARALGEQIEEFGRETVVAGLRSLPGGPN